MNKVATITVFMLLLSGCDEHGHDGVGAATQTPCPTLSTLTYENFGVLFMQDHCLGCHSTVLTGTARNGAPVDHNFDTHELVRLQLDHIDEVAGVGPAATNSFMPQSTDPPTTVERAMLSEWLACGAP